MIDHDTRSLAIILNAAGTERIAGQGDRTNPASKTATSVLLREAAS